MPYRIFLSHSTEDVLIAEEIRAVINNAFEGDIDIFLAARDLAGGDAWREVLREQLAQCDALMSVVTVDSCQRPWLIAEWSVFWVAGKTYYVVIADGLDHQQLFQPMQDRQTTKLSDEASVRRLFRRLGDASGHDVIPFRYVHLLVDSVRDAVSIKEREKNEQSLGRYRDIARPLPSDDREKEQIAAFFLSSGERDHFVRVCREIRDDSIKAGFVYSLIQKYDPAPAFAVAGLIREAEKLSVVVQHMIDLGYAQLPGLRTLLEILRKNQAEYRKVLEHLASRGEEDSELFRELALQMTNMAEARKVADFLVQNRKGFGTSLPALVGLLARQNRAELRKLALELMANELQREPVFGDVMRQLAAGNQRETEKAMIELHQHDRELFVELLASGLITSPESLARLHQL